MKVALYGLGSMGLGMARSLIAAGHTVHGHDLRPDAVADLVAGGGVDALAGDRAETWDAVVLVVVNADQMLAVLDTVETRLKPGTLVMGCATVAPDRAEAFEARLTQRGLLYLDAPISGGAAKAAEGQLTMMVSGREAAMGQARPLLDAMAETVFEMGDRAGPASAMKLVNQHLAGIHIAAMGEAMVMGAKLGIAPQRTLEVISRCAGTSWMFENRGAHVATGDYTPRSSVEIFVKDLGIVEDTARANRVPTPLAAASLQQFLAAAGLGLGREDDAAVAKVTAKLSGVTLPGDTT
ncbi:MAG: L-threonate dehydrogenase [Pseudomonadota bacterium]